VQEELPDIASGGRAEKKVISLEETRGEGDHQPKEWWLIKQIKKRSFLARRRGIQTCISGGRGTIPTKSVISKKTYRSEDGGENGNMRKIRHEKIRGDVAGI